MIENSATCSAVILFGSIFTLAADVGVGDGVTTGVGCACGVWATTAADTPKAIAIASESGLKNEDIPGLIRRFGLITRKCGL